MRCNSDVVDVHQQRVCGGESSENVKSQLRCVFAENWNPFSSLVIFYERKKPGKLRFRSLSLLISCEWFIITDFCRMMKRILRHWPTEPIFYGSLHVILIIFIRLLSILLTHSRSLITFQWLRAMSQLSRYLLLSSIRSPYPPYLIRFNELKFFLTLELSFAHWWWWRGREGEILTVRRHSSARASQHCKRGEEEEISVN